MLLTLCRHGETVGNRTRITQGQQPGELTHTGAEQAERLGKRLSKDRFNVVISSDLNRTLQTTANVVKHFQTALPIHVDPLLREKSAGVYEGKPGGTVQNAARQAGEDIRDFRPEKGENWNDVCQRAGTFMEKLIARSAVEIENGGRDIPALISSKTCYHVLCISHGGFIKEVLNWLSRRAQEDSREVPCPTGFSPNNAKNTSVYQFAIIPGKTPHCRFVVRLIKENNVDHLAGFRQRALPGGGGSSAEVDMTHLNIVPWIDFQGDDTAVDECGGNDDDEKIGGTQKPAVESTVVDHQETVPSGGD